MTQDAHESSDMDLSSLLNLSKLPDDPVMLKELLAQLIVMLRKETKRREEVERAIDQLIKNLRRSRSSQDSPGQQYLFDIESVYSDPQPAETPLETTPGLDSPEEAKPNRKGHPHGRRRPPDNLETIEVVHDIPQEFKATFAEGELRPLADVITYQYDYRPGKIIVIRHIQRKYLRQDLAAAQSPPNVAAEADAAADSTVDAVATSDLAENQPTTEQVVAAPVMDKSQLPRILLAPKRLIMSSCLAAPGLLAFVWLSKFGDHLPLYRQETIAKRFGIQLARSTLCAWMIELAGQLRELHKTLISEVLRSRVMHTDDTTVQRQDVETGKWSTARFWNYVGDENYLLTAIQFTLNHERTHPATFLRNYEGYLQADAYNGYDGIYLESRGKIIEVGCWQHARKRFKAARASDMRAEVALAFIKGLYAIERRLQKSKQHEWAELSIDERAAHVKEVRQRETVPLLKNFGNWLHGLSGNVLPKSELGEAIRYTLNQWDALQVFTTCGLLDPDNNEAERAHRGIAIGRNNWKFVGSDRGGEAAAIHFSFIASCKMNNLDPFAWLVDVLGRLPYTPREQLVDLLPHRWRPVSSAKIPAAASPTSAAPNEAFIDDVAPPAVSASTDV